jgi:formate-dependent phosphoribosylglycinamide formyltransferase (GAR transformylase)
VILAEKNATGNYSIEGIEKALEDKSVDFRIFGKPSLKSYRRMGIILAETLDKAKIAAKKVSVLSKT